MSRQSKGGSRLQKRSFGEWISIPKNQRRIVIWAILAVLIVGILVFVKLYVRPPAISAGSTGGDSGIVITNAPVETATDETKAVETETVEESVTAQVEGRKDGVYTILVFGEDTSSGNTDTIMLVTLDTVNVTANIVSVPRDSMVNIKNNVKKVNSVYQLYGLEELTRQIAGITGITADAYVKVNWEGVGTLVDAIGGVNFEVPYDMDYDDPAQDLAIHLSSGYQLLDGDKAMQLVRWRKNNDGSVSVGDIGRLNIQHDFLIEVAKQTLNVENITKLDQLVKVFNENVETDLTLGNMLWFANQLSSIDLENDLHFYTLPGNVDGMYNGLSYVLLSPEEIAAMMNESFNPYTKEITVDDLQIVYVTSDGELAITSGVLAG